MTELTRGIDLHPGDCLDVLATLPCDHFDSCVCDPPYGLEFMGKEWDAPWQVSSSAALFTALTWEAPHNSQELAFED